MRPSSSLVTTALSTSSVEYIHRLESEIVKLKEARDRDEEEWAKEQKARAKQDEVQKNILNFLRSKGYDDAFTYRGGSSSSQITYWLVLYLQVNFLCIIWKFIFAFYNLYIRSCGFNLLVWLLLIHY